MFLGITIQEYNDADSKNVSREINLSAIVSYYYTFVYKKHWFASAGLSTGLNQSFQKDTETIFNSNTETVENDYVLNALFRGRFNIGYNSDTFYSGLNYNFDNLSNLNQDNESLRFSRNYFQFYVGYRFNAPNVIQKIFD